MKDIIVIGLLLLEKIKNWSNIIHSNELKQ